MNFKTNWKKSQNSFQEFPFDIDIMTKELDIKNDQTEVKKIKKPKCPVCNVKLSLIDQACLCRCQKAFCQRHLFAENHSCEFDYKSHGRSTLKNLNPGCKYDKVKGI